MSLSAVRHARVASRTILLTCCAVFLWQSLQYPWGHFASKALGFTPAYFFTGGTPDPNLSWAPFSVTLITYMFLHAGWLQLLANMLYLWIFGGDVEDALGQPGFIILYLLCGMAAVLAQALPDPASTMPVIGAGGAISGVLGAYLLLCPRPRINLPVPICIVWDVVRPPAWALLALWFGVQLLLDHAGSGVGGGVAFRAHIGGFFAGMLMAPVFMRVTGRRRERLSDGERGLIR